MEYVPLKGRQRDPGTFGQGRLIVPAVSVGNAGQLAVDMLIATLNLVEEGRLLGRSVQAAVGRDQYGGDSPSICTELVLYASRDSSLFVLQQRAPTVTGRQEEFAEDMATFSQGFKEVVILGSLDAVLMRDGELNKQAVHALTWDGAIRGACEGVELDFVEEEALRDIQEVVLPPWPLYRRCRTLGIPAVLLLVFATDSDSLWPAEQLAKAASGLTGRAPGGTVHWRHPGSWARLYGAA